MCLYTTLSFAISSIKHFMLHTSFTNLSLQFAQPSVCFFFVKKTKNFRKFFWTFFCINRRPVRPLTKSKILKVYICFTIDPPFDRARRADSEYVSIVLSGLTWPKKSPKNPFFGVKPKKGKIHWVKKKIFFRPQTKHVFLGCYTRWTRWWKNFSLWR